MVITEFDLLQPTSGTYSLIDFYHKLLMLTLANYSSWRRERHFDSLLQVRNAEVSRGVTFPVSLANESPDLLCSWYFLAYRETLPCR